MQMPGVFMRRTAVVSRASSAASDGGRRTRLAAPASERVVRKLRLVCIAGIVVLPLLYGSRLQLAFKLAQETPVGTVSDDLLRARLDHADFVQTKGVEPDRVLWV